ncbi:hypothetical protein ACS91J_16575 [Pectobacterium carotovorum]|nr:hypothetical protein [Pectobacterium odoriferum]GKX43523.1 hypothetical protein SOASR015_25570 [Pectobacterium carotovorum subsp. carotovorum]GLX57566.1 hypothetical protein Pcaca02_28750 [Pectobacterium carotovorum subsp. carotovorum]
MKALKYVIPRKLYPVPAQAKVGHRVVAREDIPREAFMAILAIDA